MATVSGPLKCDSLLTVKIPDTPSDLVSCLSMQFGVEESADAYNNTPYPRVLAEPSEVIAFQLMRSGSTGATNEQATVHSSVTSTVPFRYPMHLYLDQFMFPNLELASKKRESRRNLLNSLHQLNLKKEGVTQHKVSPGFQRLRCTLTLAT